MKKANLFLIIAVIISCIVIANNTLDFYNSKEDTLTREQQLDELYKINKKLGVEPEDLADPRSRSVSQEAQDQAQKKAELIKIESILEVNK